MRTASLIALDQILVVGVAGLWAAAAGTVLTAARGSLAAGPRSAAPGTAGQKAVPAGQATGTADRSRRNSSIAAALCAAAIAATALRVVLTVQLARAGWWFVGEKVTLALPLVVVPGVAAAVISIPRLLPGRRDLAGTITGAGMPPRARGGRGSARLVAFPVLVAAYGAAAGVACGVVVSFPVTAAAAVAVLAFFAGASAATWRLLPPGRGADRWHLAGAAVLVVALVWAVPGRLQGGALHAGHGAAAAGVPVSRLLGPSGPDARRFTLTARPATVRLPSGRTAEAWSFNGQVPGPVLRVRQGDLVEVTLHNALPGQPVTIHWHGYDVPAGEDGVPGVTQDAVPPGGTHVYRFLASDAGTYWYHSHQNPSVAVPRGLFGMLVVDPAKPAAPGTEDHTIALHTFGDRLTMSVDGAGPTDGLARARFAPGAPVRLRVADTDSLPRILGLSGVPYRIAAVDGGDVPQPAELSGRRLSLAAGGRYDLTFTMPSRPVLLSVEGHPGLLLNGSAPPPAASGPLLDITTYGARAAVPAHFGRRVTWVLDKTLALVDGVPKLGYTVNGKAWPNIPTPVVRLGETIEITVVNRSGDTHPMHPHGHHVQVLSRDGVPANGLRMDTFDVAPGEVWKVALVADNPGVWMSHCHDLAHAVQGMEFHLAYEGITTPFDVTGGNRPA